MKNKSVVIGFILIISLLCLYYLSFTLVSRNFEKDAELYATDTKGNIDFRKQQQYLDSIWTEPVYNFFGMQFTYQEVKQNELALGLDLQGGMHVTLEVSPIEILKVMSGNSKKPDFLKAIELAKERQKDSQDPFIEIFFDAFEEIAPEGKLSKFFTNSFTRGKISSKSTNEEVKEVIRTEVNDALDRSFEIIRARIDKFGVTNPNIQKLPGTGRIMVELPGVSNPERVRKLLSGVAKLEFVEVWNLDELATSFQLFNEYLAKNESSPEPNGDKKDSIKIDNDLVARDTLKSKDDGASDLVANDDDEQSDLVANDEEEQQDDLVAKTDSAEKEDIVAKGDSAEKTADSAKTEESTTDSTQVAPTSTFLGQVILFGDGAMFVAVKDTAKVNEMLNREEVKAIFPSNVKFLWAAKPNENGGLIELYAVKKARNGKAPLEGDVIVDARQDFEDASPAVSMRMNSSGAKKWKKLTGKNIGRRVAIVLDDNVYSAPVVRSEIGGGSSSISGNFTIEEAQDLANILKAGKLPAPTRIVEEAIVGPSLGQESVNQGLTSMLIGLSLVIIFMILYYQLSGAVADVALIANIFFILGILVPLHAVLTLPGLAGLVLTIGMSVDANVLIYERIREEVKKGIKIQNAISLGYQKAYSSIIDANVTTFLTGVILYAFGSGGVKGFAVVLMIGIASSLFSAVFITRLIIEAVAKKRKLTFESAISKNLFQNSKIGFIDKRKIAYMGSGALIAIGIVLVVMQGGLNLGVDFKGGRSYVVEFTEPVTATEARSEISKQFKESSVEVKTFGANNKLKITTSYLIDDESQEADTKVKDLVMSGLEKYKGKKPEIISSSKVGATIADDIANTSFYVVIFSLIVIFLYIFARFQKWQYGLGALAALFHDVMIVISLFAMARLFGIAYEVDQVFIAAMLTIIGYSINDTVVVFDRIREFAGDITKTDFGTRLNEAINQTLSRTVMTSSTTLLVVLILFLAGGEVLRGFSFALLVGVLVGTYSSVFIASPIVLDFAAFSKKVKGNSKAAKPAKKKTSQTS